MAIPPWQLRWRRCCWDQLAALMWRRCSWLVVASALVGVELASEETVAAVVAVAVVVLLVVVGQLVLVRVRVRVRVLVSSDLGAALAALVVSQAAPCSADLETAPRSPPCRLARSQATRATRLSSVKPSPPCPSTVRAACARCVPSVSWSPVAPPPTLTPLLPRMRR